MPTTSANKLRRRHVLAALLGRTPQVLTEALYALCVDNGIPISAIQVISTQEGMRAAQEHLLQLKSGWFHCLQRRYPRQFGEIQFAADDILVAHDGLVPLQDLHTRQHSENFLELILRMLWDATSDSSTAVHCSLAGGRKTMSTYMALVNQMAKQG